MSEEKNEAVSIEDIKDRLYGFFIRAEKFSQLRKLTPEMSNALHNTYLAFLQMSIDEITELAHELYENIRLELISADNFSASNNIIPNFHPLEKSDKHQL